MAVLGLNHVNIRTTDLAATVRFHTELLGFTYRGPEPIGGFERNWLLDGQGRPIIHLRTLEPSAAVTGPIDHVALDCEDCAALTARLDAGGVKYARMDGLVEGVTQVFLTDPNGVPLELNFAKP